MATKVLSPNYRMTMFLSRNKLIKSLRKPMDLMILYSRYNTGVESNSKRQYFSRISTSSPVCKCSHKIN